jgi:primase-polymerase (primpol)-like protein
MKDDEVIRWLNKAPVLAGLWKGEWVGLFGSQSEGDQCLMNAIKLVAVDDSQMKSVFLKSELGKQSLRKREGYITYLIRKSFRLTL